MAALPAHREARMETAMYFNIEPYHSVLARMTASMHEPQLFSLLSGVEGCGKTTLLHQLRARLEDSGCRTAYFPVCPDSPAAVRKLVEGFFNLPSSSNFSGRLQEHVFKDDKARAGVVLIFDDCQHMSNKTLLETCRLTDIQINDNRMLGIILCGTPVLSERILSIDKLKMARQRISQNVELPALDKQTLEAFVTQYFQHIGKPGVHFDAAALTLLHKSTRGLPGEVLNFCEQIARNRANNSELDTISKNDVIEALNLTLTNLDAISNRLSLRNKGVQIAAPVFAVLALIAFGLVYQFLRETPGAKPEMAINNLPPAPVTVMTVEPETVITPPLEPVLEPALEPVLQPEPEVVIAQASEPAVVTAPDDAIPVTVEAAQEDAKEQAIAAWTMAWEARDMDAYFASYHADFVPRYADSLTAWRQNRVNSITTRAWIELEVTDIEVLSATDNYAEMRFWLKYSSPNYSDETLKKLDLIREDQRWLIVGETNLEVR